MLKFKVEKSTWFFWGVILILFLSYSYHKVLFYPIHSIHSWRQADCVSLAKNFMDESNLLEPSIHNYISDGGESGKTAGEFTLLYYVIGKVWNITGTQLWIYRLINLGVLVLAVFQLFKILRDYWKSSFWSLITSLIILISPIIVYYGNSFLTNTTALACAIFGWNYFIRYRQKDKLNLLIISFLFFTLGGLFKITAAVSLLALFGVFSIEFLFSKWVKSIFFEKRKILTFTLFLVSFILIGAWYVYAEKYNQTHGGKYTFNDIWAIWMLDDEHYSNAIHFFSQITYRQLFAKLITWILALLGIFSFYITWKKGLQFFVLYTLLILGFSSLVLSILIVPVFITPFEVGYTEWLEPIFNISIPTLDTFTAMIIGIVIGLFIKKDSLIGFNIREILVKVSFKLISGFVFFSIGVNILVLSC